MVVTIDIIVTLVVIILIAVVVIIIASGFVVFVFHISLFMVRDHGPIDKVISAAPCFLHHYRSHLHCLTEVTSSALTPPPPSPPPAPTFS